MIVDNEAYLEHFGTKGMRWGVRRSRNRTLNKATRAKQKEKAVQKDIKLYKDFRASQAKDKKTGPHAKRVDLARARLNTGQSKRELKAAKARHAANKARVGSKEARRLLKKHKARHRNDKYVAGLARDSREEVDRLLNAIESDLRVSEFRGTAPDFSSTRYAANKVIRDRAAR